MFLFKKYKVNIFFSDTKPIPYIVYINFDYSCGKKLFLTRLKCRENFVLFTSVGWKSTIFRIEGGMGRNLPQHFIISCTKIYNESWFIHFSIKYLGFQICKKIVCDMGVCAHWGHDLAKMKKWTKIACSELNLHV